jgi:hypothetical protein
MVPLVGSERVRFRIPRLIRSSEFFVPPSWLTTPPRLKSLFQPYQAHPRPNTASMPSVSHPTVSILAAAIAAGVGYYVGKSTGLQKSKVICDLQEKSRDTTVLDDEFSAKPASKPESAGDSEEWESDDDDGEVSSFPELSDDCKMVTDAIRFPTNSADVLDRCLWSARTSA